VKSILSLPPVLQEVWSRVYAAVIASPHNVNAKRSDAEEQAWEAVRRANGGEMPEDDIASGDDPTQGEGSLRKFAVLVASAEYGDGWEGLALLSKKARVDATSRLLENPASSSLARVALASWKAAQRAKGSDMRDVSRATGDKTWKRSVIREALLWFADEGHYEGTYRQGAGFVDAVGLTKAREALGIPIERDDRSLMPLAEALTHSVTIGADVDEPTDEEMAEI
jgi:hypothetical protein